MIFNIWSCVAFVEESETGHASLWQEILLTIVFSIDYAVRFYATVPRSLYIFSFTGFVDFLSVAPSYVDFIYMIATNDEDDFNHGFFRAWRVIRVTKIFSHLKKLNVD